MARAAGKLVIIAATVASLALVTPPAVASLALTTPAADAVANIGTAEPRAGSCTTLYPPGGGSADVCKYWYGPGPYWGNFTWLGSSAAIYVQGSFDGRYVDLPNSGNYFHTTYMHMRACRSGSGCTAWW